jgi:hypothetical protein
VKTIRTARRRIVPFCSQNPQTVEKECKYFARLTAENYFFKGIFPRLPGSAPCANGGIPLRGYYGLARKKSLLFSRRPDRAHTGTLKLGGGKETGKYTKRTSPHNAKQH